MKMKMLCVSEGPAVCRELLETGHQNQLAMSSKIRSNVLVPGSSRKSPAISHMYATIITKCN